MAGHGAQITKCLRMWETYGGGPFVLYVSLLHRVKVKFQVKFKVKSKVKSKMKFKLNVN